ncbi:phosphoribosylformylglycinamidine cyclo-ligase [bacterium]|nr:phosphoribosylformylglycinamidine cyclo-ligase [bacterium]
MADKKTTYKDAGVNIDEGLKAVNCIKNRLKNIVQHNVLSGIGGFGGIIDISETGVKKPVLVSSVDGVGTKTKIAAKLGSYKSIGRDIVSHCIDDIAVQGAKPLFFMDYIGVSKLQAQLVDEIIEGVLEVCEEQGCTLLGGETAEMPGVYVEDEFDIVGCIVGIMEKDRIITGKEIRPGNDIIGITSSGLHTNGYSLARKVLFESNAFSFNSEPKELGATVAEELLVPHRCYGGIITALCENFSIKGMAHITGGGFVDNIPRILPDNVSAVIDFDTWPVLPIFNLIQKTGNIDKLEMYRVFNMGIGLAVIVANDATDRALSFINSNGYEAYKIGSLEKGNRKVVFN